MIRAIVVTLLALIAATFQITSGLWLGIATPELILAGCLALSLTDHPTDSLIWSLAGGLWLDMLAGTTVGSYALLFVILAGLVELLNRQIFRQPPIAIAFALLFLLAFAYQLLVNFIVGQGLDWRLIFPAVTTSLVALLLSVILQFRLTRREVIRLG